MRIIPADAGSTYDQNHGISRIEDHPRGCGEHKLYTSIQIFRKGSSPRMRGALSFNADVAHKLGGSSPRMRGALVLPVVHVRLAGIIPADSGSTSAPAEEAAITRDHPRGCGEHDFTLYLDGTAGGSSPRMRGAPFFEPPTGTGDVDHPRGCGEHSFKKI